MVKNTNIQTIETPAKEPAYSASQLATHYMQALVVAFVGYQISSCMLSSLCKLATHPPPESHSQQAMDLISLAPVAAHAHHKPAANLLLLHRMDIQMEMHMHSPQACG